MNWIHFLEENAKTYAKKEALIEQETNRSYTYEQLNDIVDKWALYLQTQNVSDGDRVAFLATNCLEHVLILLACAKIRALFVPLNFRLSQGELQDTLDRIDCKIFISKEKTNLIVHTKKVLLSDVDLELKGILTKKYALDEDPILMLFTSGSTGRPKGVLFHGRMLKTNQIETCRNWQLDHNDSTLVETPFFHTGGYNVLLLPLLFVGGTCYIAPKFDISNVIETITQKRLSVYFGVPTMFQMLQESAVFDTADFSSIRFFLSGGAAAPIEMIKKYQEKNLGFKQGFGLTEVGPNCFELSEEFSVSKLGSIGQAMKHSKVIVMKDEKIVTEPHVIGELLIKGDHLCLGYYRDSRKWHESLYLGYFKTGDLVKFDEDGFFYVVGRIKDMYISGGENVYPAEVEKQLLSHPSILDAVVVSKASDKWGEVGHAYLKSKRALSMDELREFLGDKLSRYKHPHTIENLSEFPLLANGKIDRVCLKERAKGREFC